MSFSVSTIEPNTVTENKDSKVKSKQLICPKCGIEFTRLTKDLNRTARKNTTWYCSNQCRQLGLRKYSLHKCQQCNKEVQRTPCELKNKNTFCSRSCSTTYQNSHKTTGTRVSKLKKYLQIKLKELYPNLEFIFNSPTIVGLELDIYVPSLNLAFELNGIFHYEPIFGQDKLNRTNFNDQQKYQACISNGISLCVIDTSKQKYFKDSTSQPYLDIIIKIIKGCLESNALSPSTSQADVQTSIR